MKICSWDRSDMRIAGKTAVVFLLVGVFFNVSAAQSAQPGSKSGWQAEWDQVVAAAKREGEVVVLGPPGTAVRKALTEGFQKSFPGVKVEYTGATGSRMAPRLLAERRARHYLADITIGNPGTILSSLFPVGALDPIKPLLILPEVVNRGNWWLGRFEFADRAGRYNMVFTTDVRTHIAINPQLVKKNEFRTYWDLLDPKWRGKIVMSDPMIRGPGQGTATFWYINPDLGKEFVRRLFTEQKVAFSRSGRQILEWIARGRYLIAAGPSSLRATEFKAKGLPIELVHSDQFKEKSSLNVGFGSVALINRPAHPNAAKLYVNWLLSKEGQSDYSKATGYPSRRLDVPRDRFDPAVLPKDGVNYLKAWGQDYIPLMNKTRNFVQGILRKQKKK